MTSCRIQESKEVVHSIVVLQYDGKKSTYRSFVISFQK